MKRLLLTITILTFAILKVIAQEPNKQSAQEPSDMNRTERAEKKYEELFAAEITASKTDPELMNILQRFIFGEVFYTGKLDDKTRELITITTLTVNQTLPQLSVHTNVALNVGVKPIEIRESIYQLAPFIGYPKVLNALESVNRIFESRGIQLPLENAANLKEDERLEKGKEMQEPLYGHGMKSAMKDLPEGFDTIIPDMLTTSLFADFYTRKGLDLQTRELLIYCALATLGGAERQMASHAVGNLRAGNTKETLISAMVQCYPYIGFPRISNAIKIIQEAKVD